MSFTIPVVDDLPYHQYFEISLHNAWVDWIDEECEEVGMNRMELIKELVKLGMVTWKVGTQTTDD